MPKNNRIKETETKKIQVIPGNTDVLIVQFLSEILKVLQEMRDGGQKR